MPGVKVLLIRHAHAVDGVEGMPDEARHLTAVGRAIARKVGERLHADGIVFDAMVTSPLVRAVQTAELVAQAARYGGEIECVTALAPGESPRHAAHELEGRGAAVAAIGHEPSISALAALFAGKKSHPGLRKGQVLIFDEGRLVYSLDPDRL